MAGTRRTPLNRQHRPPITEAAVRIFIEMQVQRCTCSPRDAGTNIKECPGCERYWAVHSRLSAELGCRPWEYPCIEDPDAPPTNYERDPQALARWRALEAGTRVLRDQPPV